MKADYGRAWPVFRPEFLNRIDETIVFRSLSEPVKQIVI